MKLAIRSPHLEEMPEVVHAVWDMFCADRWRYAQKKDKQKLLRLLLFLDQSGDGFLKVCRVDGELAGVVAGEVTAYLFSDSFYAFEQLFYVTKRFRGSRVLKTMLEAFEEWARKKGCVEIVLSPQLDNSEKLRDMMLKRNYENVGYIVRKAL